MSRLGEVTAGTRAARIETGLKIIQLLALALWSGALFTLGAIVAPIVFRVVPAPTNADAMTLVFRRFDGLAVGCACVALLAEGVLAALSSSRGMTKLVRVDFIRIACVVCAAVLAVAIGAWVSPGIKALHEAGALRGVGDGGHALARLHHVAEFLAKGESAFLVAAFILSVTRPSRSPKLG